MKKTHADLLQGTIDLLALKTLQSGPTHGSRYRATHPAGFTRRASGEPRLDAKGRIVSELGASENNWKAKYYKLPAAGRKQLSAETETWRRFTGALDLILKTC